MLAARKTPCCGVGCCGVVVAGCWLRRSLLRCGCCGAAQGGLGFHLGLGPRMLGPASTLPWAGSLPSRASSRGASLAAILGSHLSHFGSAGVGFGEDTGAASRAAASAVGDVAAIGAAGRRCGRRRQVPGSGSLRWARGAAGGREIGIAVGILTLFGPNWAHGPSCGCSTAIGRLPLRRSLGFARRHVASPT